MGPVPAGLSQSFQTFPFSPDKPRHYCSCAPSTTVIVQYFGKFMRLSRRVKITHKVSWKRIVADVSTWTPWKKEPETAAGHGLVAERS